jgi:hypothetical protein
VVRCVYRRVDRRRILTLLSSLSSQHGADTNRHVLETPRPGRLAAVCGVPAKMRKEHLDAIEPT